MTIISNLVRGLVALAADGKGAALRIAKLTKLEEQAETAEAALAAKSADFEAHKRRVDARVSDAAALLDDRKRQIENKADAVAQLTGMVEADEAAWQGIGLPADAPFAWEAAREVEAAA